MPRYRRDHRAVRPIYECPENDVSAKSADDCARISTLQSMIQSSLFGSEIIFEVFHPMWSRHLNVTDGQTDRRTLLWHHRATRSIAR